MHQRRFCLNWHALISLLLVCVAGPTLGLASPVDDLVSRVQAAYDQTQALSADFVQVATLTTLNREQTSTGRMYIQKPHAIRWEYTQPASQTILYKNSNLQIYTPNRKQVLQSVVNADQSSSVPLLFLAGIGTLQQSFTITSLPSTEVSSERLRLVPLSPQAGFTELQLSVNRQSAFIESLTIHDHIGNRTHIRFAALQPHSSLPAETFELVLPPDTEVLAQPSLSQ